LAGLDRTFISLIECEKRNPSLATIEKIAAALNMHAWEILKYVAETAAK
jgi:transcriptional regulator with XRE-family HTH domain